MMRALEAPAAGRKGFSIVGGLIIGRGVAKE
jgi:hypothetical protein